MSARMRILTLLAAMGTAGLASCGSGDEGAESHSTEPKTPDGAAARQFFIDKVYPSAEPTCAKCHSTGERGAPIFLASGGPASYTAVDGVPGLIADPSSSPLVQKGLHSGPALTSDQGDLITQWLKMEVSARGLSGASGKPPNLRAAFKAFGQCMDYNEWLALKIDALATIDTENQGQCRSCHLAGQASLWLSDNKVETFTKFSQFPYVQRLVVGSVNNSGAFDTLENSRRIMEKGTETQQVNANSHPRFSLSPAMMSNISTFVNNTLSNMAAGRCQNVKQPGDGGADAR